MWSYGRMSGRCGWLNSVGIFYLIVLASWTNVVFAQGYEFPSVGTKRLTDYRFEVGVVGLTREAPNSQLIAIDENFNTLLNANELAGSMQFGFKGKFDIYRFWSCCGGTDLQLVYFGVNSLDAERSLAAVAVSPIFFNSIPVSPQPTSNIIYSTNLYSGEINLRSRSSSRLRPLLGFRYMKLEEQYDAFNHDPSGGSTRIGGFSITNNSMFGGQIGAELDVYSQGAFFCYTSCKLGLVHNRVEGAARAANPSGMDVTKNFGDSNYASLVDAEAGIEYRFAGPLSFRAGYQFVYASHVALGIDQNDSVRLLSPGETVVFDAQQWHGLSLTSVLEF